MFKDSLPVQVDPFRFAENATRLSGVLQLKNMARLGLNIAEGENDDVDVELVFGIDTAGLRFAKGRVRATLTLSCQRCMQPYLYDITSEFIYGLVSSEEKVLSLAKTYEPLVIKDDILVIPDIVEEEILINLPIVPTHDPDHCQAKLPFVMVADSQAVVEKDNPFKIIELLKVKPK